MLTDFIGNTPLVQVTRLDGIGSNRLFLKLEGNNPAGSVKDRPAWSMIRRAAERGEIHPGDRLIEATSGNTGIALAMVAAAAGYPLTLIMPAHMSAERRAVMNAFGAEIVHVTQEEGMEGARDLADEMQREGRGTVLDQFGNPDNPRAHYEGTAPEIWRDTKSSLTHFVATMGTTGTIMGCSAYFREHAPDVQVVGVQPDGDSSIPGIRKWPEAYLPGIFRAEAVDRIIECGTSPAEDTMRELARREGIFCGPSSGGSVWAALQLCAELENATIAAITTVTSHNCRADSSHIFPRRGARLARRA